MKELKAAKVLKNILNIADYGRYMEEQEIIKEAIKELEELNNISCDGCKFGKIGVDHNGLEIDCSLNWKCSRGYSDKFEAKGE